MLETGVKLKMVGRRQLGSVGYMGLEVEHRCAAAIRLQLCSYIRSIISKLKLVAVYASLSQTRSPNRERKTLTQHHHIINPTYVLHHFRTLLCV